MNKLSPQHKEILNKVYDVYGRNATNPSETYIGRFSKKELRHILIGNNWNSTEAMRKIEKGDYEYAFVDD